MTIIYEQARTVAQFLFYNSYWRGYIYEVIAIPPMTSVWSWPIKYEVYNNLLISVASFMQASYLATYTVVMYMKYSSSWYQREMCFMYLAI